MFTIYRSSDTSAPALAGTTGSLVALLDAILVNGYGSKAAAGWAKSFAGSSKAAYRAPTGNRHYLRVDDAGPGGGTFKEARMTGYLTMSDVDTGTGPFPTAAQGVGGVAMVVCRKSISADATARTWICLADARTFYLFIVSEGAAVYNSFCFGEFFNVAAVPAGFHSIIIGRDVENSATATNDRFDSLTAVQSALAGHFIPSSYSGSGNSRTAGQCLPIAASSSNKFGILTYPNSPDGALYIQPVWVNDPVSVILLGRMRGLWTTSHTAASFPDGTTFSGSGDLAGKTFLVVKPGGNTGPQIFETSNTLETN